MFNKKEIERGTFNTSVVTAKKINAQLELHMMRMQALAMSLANLGSTMGSDHKKNRILLKKLIDLQGYEKFIAGGGIWPEPFVFDKTKEKSSYFFGRNKEGNLDYYDDYNDPDGSGYHNKEWYVPAKFYEEGKIDHLDWLGDVGRLGPDLESCIVNRCLLCPGPDQKRFDVRPILSQVAKGAIAPGKIYLWGCHQI